MSPHPSPPRRRALRAAALITLLGLVGFAAWQRWIVPDAVEAQVRDYLAHRRLGRHKDALLAAAAESGVDVALLGAVCLTESSGRPGAVSSKNALGLFQLSMVTALWRAEKLGLPPPTEEQLLGDPLLNARLGADNLAWLLDTYDGDVERALVAYNLGTRRLKQYCDAAGGWEAWRAERLAAGGSSLFAYASRVLAWRDRLRAEGFFGPPAPGPDAAADVREAAVPGG